MKLTVLSENTTGMGDLAAEWGLSILLESDDINLLFDCGRSFSVPYNAQKLGIDLKRLDVIVLSHSHHDHTGGLLNILSLIDKHPVTIVAHPQIQAKRVNRRPGEREKYLGLPYRREQIESSGGEFRWTTSPVSLMPDIWTSGEIPMLTDYENFKEAKVERLIEKDGKMVRDNLSDEQALFIKTEKGLLILSGCAHRGIINTLYQAVEITGERDIYAVIGGAHLLDAADIRIKKTAAALKELDVKNIFLGHCTGFTALCQFSNEFKTRFSRINAGFVLNL